MHFELFIFRRKPTSTQGLKLISLVVYICNNKNEFLVVSGWTEGSIFCKRAQYDLKVKTYMYFLLKVSCRFFRSAIFRELNMSELEYTLLDVQHNWGHYETTYFG